MLINKETTTRLSFNTSSRDLKPKHFTFFMTLLHVCKIHKNLSQKHTQNNDQNNKNDYSLWFHSLRDGTVVRTITSPQCGTGLIPGLSVRCGFSLLLVPVLALRGFSSGTPVFPSAQKPTFLNSNSIWKLPD